MLPSLMAKSSASEIKDYQYDRLEKINNRGENTCVRKRRWIPRRKNSQTVEVEYEDRIIIDEVRRKMKTLRKSPRGCKSNF